MQLTITMNAFYLFIYILIFTIQAHSEPAVKQIDQLNQPGFGLPNKECQHCLNYTSESEATLTPEKESELFQKCAVDLCGPANENLMYILNNNAFDNEDIGPKIAKRFNKMIRPSIEEALQAERDYNTDVLSILQDKLEDPQSNIKPQEWDEIAEALSMKIAMDNAAAAMSTGPAHTNNSVSASNVNNYPSEIARNGDTSYKANKTRMTPVFASAALFNLSSTSPERQRDLLKERYEDFLEDYQNNKTKFTEEDRQTITRLGKHLERRALDSLAFADSLDRLIKKSKGVTFCKEDCKKWVLDELSSLNQDLKKNTSNDGQTQRLTRQLNHCQSVYNANTQNEQQMNIYKQNFNQYAGQFLIKAFKNYSDFSRQSYKNYMNTTLNVFFPPSERSVEQQLVEDIKEETTHIASYSNNKIANTIQNRERLGDEYSLCLSPMQTMASGDFFSPEANMISVSNFSCTFHEHGKQVLAHELAHALSHWFSKNKQKLNKPNKPSRISYRRYMKLRRCANRRYKTKDQPKMKIPFRFRHKHDKFRTEEDMADLIAYQVFQEEPTLFQCSSFLPSGDDSKYAFLHILHPPPPKEEVQAIMPPDPHSTPLLRAITEAIHKGKPLSPACQQVVDAYKDRINFEPCF